MLLQFSAFNAVKLRNTGPHIKSRYVNLSISLIIIYIFKHYSAS